jgi:hypothetical protein
MTPDTDHAPPDEPIHAHIGVGTGGGGGGGSSDPIPIDCDTLHELAVAYSPVLRFHESERFFPALAESWLTHTTEAPWPDDASHVLGDFAIDPRRRGMALCEMIADELGVIAGPTIGGNRPLQLSTHDTDSYAIGRDVLTQVTDKTFLNLAGWRPDSNFSAGDTERLFSLFSELGAAINQSLDWKPPLGLDDLPHAWIPQPVNPTTYCEASWAGRSHKIGKENGRRDFADGDVTLDGYLALTYYYLYPAKEPGIDGTGPTLEGQWEAVTLFFEGKGLAERLGATVVAPPEYVVVSQGIDQASDYHHRTELRRWTVTEQLGAHPVVYVAKGTHRFYFEPVSGQTGNPPDPVIGTDPGDHDDDGHAGGFSDLGLLGLALLGLAALIALIFGIVVFPIILVVLALWLIFEWLKSLWDSHSNDGSGDPVPGGYGNDEAGDDGTQGGGDEPPGDSTPPDSGGGFGLPNTGSPTGRATVSFDVRLVDRFFEFGERTTGYPSPTICESPTWWNYSGGWGVRMVDGFGTGWENGTRRIDEFGRSWTYWNGLRLSTVINGGNTQG